MAQTYATPPGLKYSTDSNSPPNTVQRADDWLADSFSSLVDHARTRWLTLPEAAAFMYRGAKRAVDIIYEAVGPVGPPVRPEAGSLFIVDERRLSNWREDGYEYIPMPDSDRARPVAGIRYSDGSIYGSRAAIHRDLGASTVGSLPAGVAGVTDTLTLTFLQPASTPSLPLSGPGAGAGAGTGFHAAASLFGSPGGTTAEFLEQTIVLEWALVRGLGSGAVLQRRAIRLPRIGSGTGAGGVSLADRSGVQGLKSPGAQDSGWIWLVHYLTDVTPPIYTPEGMPTTVGGAGSAAATQTSTANATALPASTGSGLAGSSSDSDRQRHQQFESTAESIRHALDLLHSPPYVAKVVAGHTHSKPVAAAVHIEEDEILAALREPAAYSDFTRTASAAVLPRGDPRAAGAQAGVEGAGTGTTGRPEASLSAVSEGEGEAMGAYAQHWRDKRLELEGRVAQAKAYAAPARRTEGLFSPSRPYELGTTSGGEGGSDAFVAPTPSMPRGQRARGGEESEPARYAEDEAEDGEESMMLYQGQGQDGPPHDHASMLEASGLQHLRALDRAAATAARAKDIAAAAAEATGTSLSLAASSAFVPASAAYNAPQAPPPPARAPVRSSGTAGSAALPSAEMRARLDALQERRIALAATIRGAAGGSDAKEGVWRGSTASHSLAGQDRRGDAGGEGTEGEGMQGYEAGGAEFTLIPQLAPSKRPPGSTPPRVSPRRQLCTAESQSHSPRGSHPHPTRSRIAGSAQGSPARSTGGREAEIAEQHEKLLQMQRAVDEAFDAAEQAVREPPAAPAPPPLPAQPKGQRASLSAPASPTRAAVLPAAASGTVLAPSASSVLNVQPVQAAQGEKRKEKDGKKKKEKKGRGKRKGRSGSRRASYSSTTDASSTSDSTSASDESSATASTDSSTSSSSSSSYSSSASSARHGRGRHRRSKGRESSRRQHRGDKDRGGHRHRHVSRESARRGREERRHRSSSQREEREGQRRRGSSAEDRRRPARGSSSPGRRAGAVSSGSRQAQGRDGSVPGRVRERTGVVVRGSGAGTSMAGGVLRPGPSLPAPGTVVSAAVGRRAMGGMGGPSGAPMAVVNINGQLVQVPLLGQQGQGYSGYPSASMPGSLNSSMISSLPASAPAAQGPMGMGAGQDALSRLVSQELQAEATALLAVQAQRVKSVQEQAHSGLYSSMVGRASGMYIGPHAGSGMGMGMGMGYGRGSMVQGMHSYPQAPPPSVYGSIGPYGPTSGAQPYSSQPVPGPAPGAGPYGGPTSATEYPPGASNPYGNPYGGPAASDGAGGLVSGQGQDKQQDVTGGGASASHGGQGYEQEEHHDQYGPPGQYEADDHVHRSEADQPGEGQGYDERQFTTTQAAPAPPSDLPSAVSPPLPAAARRAAEAKRLQEEGEMAVAVAGDHAEGEGEGQGDGPMHRGAGQAGRAEEEQAGDQAKPASPAAKPGGGRKQSGAAQTSSGGGSIRWASTGSGVVSLDARDRYESLCTMSVAARLRAMLRGWRTRTIFRLKKTRTLTSSIKDTRKLLSELRSDPSADAVFVSSIQAQLEAAVQELRVLVVEEEGLAGTVQLATLLAARAKARKAAKKPLNAPLLNDAADEEEEAEAAAKGARRAAGRKNQLKGGALGRAVMARYSKTARRDSEGGDGGEAEEEVGDAESTAAGGARDQTPAAHRAAEKPWLKAAGKPRAGSRASDADDDEGDVLVLDKRPPKPSKALTTDDGGEDVVVRKPPRPTGQGRGSRAASDADQEGGPTLPAKVRRASGVSAGGGEKQQPFPDDDKHHFGCDLQPSGKWRVVVEVIGAKNLAPALYALGTLAAGPGLKADVPLDPTALTPATDARDTYAVCYLAKHLHVSGRAKQEAQGEEGGEDKVKVVGKKLQTSVAPKSLSPEWKSRFVFTLPSRTGLVTSSHNPFADLHAAMESAEDIAGMGLQLAGWEVRVDVLDSDRYVRDTAMGQASVPLERMPHDQGKRAWITLHAASVHDRVKGQVQLRYRLVPPEHTMRVQVLREDIQAALDKGEQEQGQGRGVEAGADDKGLVRGGARGSSLATSIVGAGRARSASAGPGQAPAGSDVDEEGDDAPFLKRRSRNPKPKAVDWSHVQAKTRTGREDSQGPGPAGSQTRPGGQVRMYKMPDYSKVRSKVSSQAGLDNTGSGGGVSPPSGSAGYAAGGGYSARSRQGEPMYGRGSLVGASVQKNSAVGGPVVRAGGRGGSKGKGKELDDEMLGSRYRDYGGRQAAAPPGSKLARPGTAAKGDKSNSKGVAVNAGGYSLASSAVEYDGQSSRADEGMWMRSGAGGGPGEIPYTSRIPVPTSRLTAAAAGGPTVKPTVHAPSLDSGGQGEGLPGFGRRVATGGRGGGMASAPISASLLSDDAPVPGLGMDDLGGLAVPGRFTYPQGGLLHAEATAQAQLPQRTRAQDRAARVGGSVIDSVAASIDRFFAGSGQDSGSVPSLEGGLARPPSMYQAARAGGGARAAPTDVTDALGASPRSSGGGREPLLSSVSSSGSPQRRQAGGTGGYSAMYVAQQAAASAQAGKGSAKASASASSTTSSAVAPAIKPMLTGLAIALPKGTGGAGGEGGGGMGGQAGLGATTGSALMDSLSPELRALLMNARAAVAAGAPAPGSAARSAAPAATGLGTGLGGELKAEAARFAEHLRRSVADK